MKGAFRKLSSLLIAICLIFSLCIFGCDCDGDPTGDVFDNEVDPLILSSQEVDGVFNPFFATAGPDTNIIGMTQMGMLSNTKDGQPEYGEGKATIALDLEIKTTGAGETQRTEYKFVLKNDIKFSNGSPLTMKDVLFTMYVYLDNMYTGSTTMYSTDIVGLQEYRTGQSDEKEQNAFEQNALAAAAKRISALVMAVDNIRENHNSAMSSETQFKQYLTQYQQSGGPSNAHVVEDYEKAIKLYKEEIDQDWLNSVGSYDSIKFTHSETNQLIENLLTTNVEAFLYSEGMLTWNRKDNKLESQLTNDPTELKKWSETQAKDAVYAANIPSNIDQIVQYYGTASTLTTYLSNKYKEDYFDEHGNPYKNISGIKFANFSEPVTVNGKTYEKPTYNNDGSVASGNEVLSITIKKVDPKAIWNFSFGVAPMYYYSSVGASVPAGKTEKDYPIAEYDYANDKFGVVANKLEFMQNVVNDPLKIGVPMGAGPYKASTSSGSVAGAGDAGKFNDKGVIYFERNEYYFQPAKIKKLRYQIVSNTNMLNSVKSGELDFAEPEAKPENITDLGNLKKQGLGYTSIRTNGYGYIGVNAGKVPDLEVRRAIMYAIDTAETAAYYGTTATAIHRSMSLESWAYPRNSAGKPSATAYYPYIGGKVPDNLAVVDPYYRNYVKNVKDWATGYTPTTQEQYEFIESLIKSSDSKYSKGTDGVYVSRGGHKLNYTFTIAGQETDHPAYGAMLHASELLNQCGFNITVTTDSNALKKLSSGALTVWAAAWSSTIDPDMYQVYHKDSKATSTLNWGYQQIKTNAGGKYDRELALVEELSLLIEQGRETEEKDTKNGVLGRKDIYSKALDKVMELAVELPTYQRDDLFAYRANKIDETTFTAEADRSPYKGLMSDIQLVSLITEK